MEIEWSRWFAWDQRWQIPCVQEEGGVYVIGRGFKPKSTAKPGSKKVIYIGYTTGILLGRLDRFNRACRGRRGHAGGNTFFKTYIADEPDYERAWLREQERQRIRVAIGRPVGRPAGASLSLLEEGQLKLEEVRLQVEFVRRHKRLPELNKRFG